MNSFPPTADELRATFEEPAPLTVGLEEELMLLDPETLDLAPRAREVLERVTGDDRFKLELPAAQLEIMLPPRATVREAVADLGAARQMLAAATEGLVRPAAAGLHPFAAPEGEVNPGERYERTLAEYGSVARRQLVGALQVHVAVRGADRALAVYNGLRRYLPELAALAANAPFHAGSDTGLASARPAIAQLLPRQGLPPPIASWEELAGALRWGAAASVVPEPRRWWWELRPHPLFGTLELRVPDAQSTVADAAAVAAFVQALAGWLADRHDAGDALPDAPSWRIEENRWSAARGGVEGTLADLETGARAETRSRLQELIDAIAPTARGLGCGDELESARELVQTNGAMRQRDVARDRGLRGLVAWLADEYLDGTRLGIP